MHSCTQRCTHTHSNNTESTPRSDLSRRARVTPSEYWFRTEHAFEAFTLHFLTVHVPHFFWQGCCVFFKSCRLTTGKIKFICVVVAKLNWFRYILWCSRTDKGFQVYDPSLSTSLKLIEFEETSRKSAHCVSERKRLVKNCPCLS